MSSRVVSPLCLAAVLLLSGCATPPSPDAYFRSQAALHGNRAAVISNVPDLPRRDISDDSAAVLANVASFWGRSAGAAEVSELMNRLRSELSSEAAIIAGAESLGLWAFSAYGTPEGIAQKVRAGVPVIVLLQDWSGIESRRFSLVTAFDDETKQFLCHDGAAAPNIVSYEEFLRKWMPARFWMAVVCTPAGARWTLTPQDLVSRARFHDARNDHAAARADYEAVLATDPKNEQIKRALALVAQKAGDLTAAELALRELHTRNPEDNQTANNLAYILARQRKGLDEAELIAREVVRRDPAGPAALDTLGYVLIQRKNFKEAIPLLEKSYERAQALPPAAQREIAVHLALAYLGDRQDELMRKIISEILAVDPAYQLPDELKKKIDKL